MRKKVTEGTTITTTDYLDASTWLSTSGFQYKNEMLEFFPHPEGFLFVQICDLATNRNPDLIRE
ncbi:MAG: hypothetical protein Q4G27_10145 [Flavobacteriaceae bacterium]|nr:hypothetical protein [Flavobacteriaceae bacterium]